jgi:hypothetical protein
LPQSIVSLSTLEPSDVAAIGRSFSPNGALTVSNNSTRNDLMLFSLPKRISDTDPLVINYIGQDSRGINKLSLQFLDASYEPTGGQELVPISGKIETTVSVPSNSEYMFIEIPLPNNATFTIQSFTVTPASGLPILDIVAFLPDGFAFGDSTITTDKRPAALLSAMPYSKLWVADNENETEALLANGFSQLYIVDSDLQAPTVRFTALYTTSLIVACVSVISILCFALYTFIMGYRH